MRGVFTAGVLDAFMKHEIYFRHVVAVSAGAGNGLSYMSRQPRRAHVCNIDLLTKYDYIGLRHLFTQGCIFDPHLLYERFPYELIPYDYDAYYRYARRGFTFEMVTTNCLTGRADYLTETSGDPARLNRLALASASLPFVAPITYIDGTPMLDGGIIDSIPVERSIALGHAFNVVVCTREKGWRNTGTRPQAPGLRLSQLSALARGAEPSHSGLQRPARHGRSDGGRGTDRRDTPRAARGRGPHGARRGQAGGALRGGLPAGRRFLPPAALRSHGRLARASSPRTDLARL